MCARSCRSWPQCDAPIVLSLLPIGGAQVLRRFRGRDARPPPKQGEPITIAITDIQGSTTLWENVPPEVSDSGAPQCVPAAARGLAAAPSHPPCPPRAACRASGDGVRHKSAPQVPPSPPQGLLGVRDRHRGGLVQVRVPHTRGRHRVGHLGAGTSTWPVGLRDRGGHDTARCRQREGVTMMPPVRSCAQLDLLCAPWSAVVEDGGHELLCNEDTWADTTCPLMEFDPAAVLGAVSDGAMTFLTTLLSPVCIAPPPPPSPHHNTHTNKHTVTPTHTHTHDAVLTQLSHTCVWCRCYLFRVSYAGRQEGGAAGLEPHVPCGRLRADRVQQVHGSKGEPRPRHSLITLTSGPQLLPSAIDMRSHKLFITRSSSLAFEH